MPSFQNEPRPVPFALRECTEQVVDCLVASGILHRVESSAWTAPIVPVPKKNGQIHIWGDYKVTMNQALEGRKLAWTVLECIQYDVVFAQL